MHILDQGRNVDMKGRGKVLALLKNTSHGMQIFYESPPVINLPYFWIGIAVETGC